MIKPFFGPDVYRLGNEYVMKIFVVTRSNEAETVGSKLFKLHQNWKS